MNLKADKTQCILCERRCVLSPGQAGVCKTRRNINAKLYTLVYGDLSAVESRPIEIKPFFHYWPGSTALTFSTWSCNFACPWCQNHTLSRAEPKPERSTSLPPDRIVEMALESSDQGLCASFQEPTLLTDWAAEAFAIARERGLYCCYVSNGYMTLEALDLLVRSGMDGLKIDIKGIEETYRRYCGQVDASIPWRNAEAAKKMGVHVEIVNLIIPSVNDSDWAISSVVDEHLKHLGPDVPMHFTRYVPAYRFHQSPTSIGKLEHARELARKSGVRFPYLGNVRGHRFENTFCPDCGECLIVRDACTIVGYRLDSEKRCPKCRTKILITGMYAGSNRS